MSAARTTRTPMSPSGVGWAAFSFFPCQRWVLAGCNATRRSSPDTRRRLGIIRAAVGPTASPSGTQTSCGLSPNATRFVARASGIRPALGVPKSEFFTNKNPRVDTREVPCVHPNHPDGEATAPAHAGQAEEALPPGGLPEVWCTSNQAQTAPPDMHGCSQRQPAQAASRPQAGRLQATQARNSRPGTVDCPPTASPVPP